MFIQNVLGEGIDSPGVFAVGETGSKLGPLGSDGGEGGVNDLKVVSTLINEEGLLTVGASVLANSTIELNDSDDVFKLHCSQQSDTEFDELESSTGIILFNSRLLVSSKIKLFVVTGSCLHSQVGLANCCKTVCELN